MTPFVDCTCSTFSHITADRNSIRQRINESKQLKKLLTLLTKDAKGNKLYRCDKCEQLWQGSKAWNWGGNEYLFKVPAVDIDEWKLEPFVQPDELILYIARMESYNEHLDKEETSELCKAAECRNHAIKLSIYCLPHHIAQLQQSQILPSKPSGRYFLPSDGN